VAPPYGAGLAASARRVSARSALWKCGPVTAAGLRVYPPNQTQSRVTPFPFTACSKNGPVYLTIGPVGFP
jgi:hypothetical protein